MLPEALNQGTFAVASSSITNEALLASVVHVNQNSDQLLPYANQLLSLSKTPVVAVVDRTADVKLAAQELVAARLAFGGQSPYAPDIVLVNEFVKKNFLRAVVNASVDFQDSARENTASAHRATRERIEELQKADPDLRIIVHEPYLAVLDSSSRASSLKFGKMDAPILTVHDIKSLDDAIDLVSSASSGPCLAAYHFGQARTSKYLTQFIDAKVSFVNHIPRQLLIGPAYPDGHPVDPDQRYPPSMFTVRRPAYIVPGLQFVVLVAALSSESNAAATQLLAEAVKPLAVKKRSEGGAVGFFEQGFLLYASVLLCSAVGLSGAGWYVLAKHGRRFW